MSNPTPSQIRRQRERTMLSILLYIIAVLLVPASLGGYFPLDIAFIYFVLAFVLLLITTHNITKLAAQVKTQQDKNTQETKQ